MSDWVGPVVAVVMLLTLAYCSDSNAGPYVGRGMYTKQFRTHIIRPTLKHLGVYHGATEDLLFCTVSHESLGGRLLKQVSGSALGAYQIEPRTHNDLWDNYLKYKPRLSAKVKLLCVKCDAEETIYNMRYATAIAYLVYERAKSPIPKTSNLYVLGAFYKRYYNTYLGSATVKQFIRDCKLWK